METTVCIEKLQKMLSKCITENVAMYSDIQYASRHKVITCSFSVSTNLITHEDQMWTTATLTISLFCRHLCRRAFYRQSESSKERFQLDQIWIFCTQTPETRTEKFAKSFCSTDFFFKVFTHQECFLKLLMPLTVRCQSASVDKEWLLLRRA